MIQDQDKSKSVIDKIESSVDPSVATAEDISNLIDNLSDEDLQLLPESQYEFTDEEIYKLFTGDDDDQQQLES